MFISPHNDDESLFGFFSIFRYKPKVYIVTRSIRQESRGISYKTRNKETLDAMNSIGVEVEFLDIPETELTVELLEKRLKDIDAKLVFAPGLQGGHPDHDIVSVASSLAFGNKIIYYSTYTIDNLTPQGKVYVSGLKNFHDKKIEVLSHYKSQLPHNQIHFDAVYYKPEAYLNDIKDIERLLNGYSRIVEVEKNN